MKVPHIFSPIEYFKEYYLKDTDVILNITSCTSAHRKQLSNTPYKIMEDTIVKAIYEPEINTLHIIEYREGK